MRRLLIVVLVLVLAALACNGGNGNGDSSKEVEIEAEVVEKIESAQIEIQEVVEQLETELPEPTEWIVYLECLECEEAGIPLALWGSVDGKGKSPGMVNHGDMCIVLEVGSHEGVERYKINCDGMVGWLRAEGLVTAEPIQELDESTKACLPVNTERQTARMVSVTDGDTIIVDISGIEFPVRYIGIDAPESEDIYGEISRNKNIELVKYQELTLIKDVSETDEYERLLRYVMVGDTCVNYELVRQGYAMAGTWEPDVACDEVFRDAENKAREEKLVIWVDKEPTDEPVRDPGGDVAINGNVLIVDIFYNGVVSDKEPDEFVEIRNDDIWDIQLNDWSLYDEADHRFKFPEYVIAPGETCRIYTNEIHPESCGFSFYYDKSAIWNNGGDCATLINANGDLVAKKCY